MKFTFHSGGCHWCLTIESPLPGKLVLEVWCGSLCVNYETSPTPSLHNSSSFCVQWSPVAPSQAPSPTNVQVPGPSKRRGNYNLRINNMKTSISIISFTLYGEEHEAQRLSNLTKAIQQIVEKGLGIRFESILPPTFQYFSFMVIIYGMLQGCF